MTCNQSMLPKRDDRSRSAAPDAASLAEAINEVLARQDAPLLPGGVSSDIRLVEHAGRRYCVKQALARLKVAADWRAPVERNHSEAEWLRVVGSIAPEAVPRVVHEEQTAGWFAMEYLDPAQYPIWKSQLRDGEIDRETATGVGRQLVRIHAATAGRQDLVRRFATANIFYPIRPEPYLIATGRAHPDLAARLQQLSDTTMRTELALVHGDVSPKNILVGKAGPVFIDAECAWYGDPAFDVAFVLNHMLLKSVWRPQWLAGYMACFDAVTTAYLAHVDWESSEELERRAAHLLPGLFLGRVDGKSPAEYITTETDRQLIRGAARQLLVEPVSTLAAVRDIWMAACAAMQGSPR